MINVTGESLIPPIMSEENRFLHLIVWFGRNKVKAIDDVLLNDIIISDNLDSDGLVTTGHYANRVRVRKHLGEPNQAADSCLVSEIPWWTEKHRLRGVAYLYVRLEWDSKVFSSGIPRISAEIT